CPFDPQEQTSSGDTLRSRSCRSRYFAPQNTAHYSIVRSTMAPRPRYCQVRRSTLPRRSSIMDMDRDHIDDAVLALLFLGRHDGMRTWKSFDWAAMERLHTKGLISDPVGKAKSVVFTDEGLRQSEALFRKL